LPIEAPISPAPPIELDLDWLARKLGRVSKPEVRAFSKACNSASPKPARKHFSVTIPSWRATKDVAMPDDLVEEVGRMIGYDSIEPAPPLVPCAPSYDPPEREFLRGIKRTDGRAGLHRSFQLLVHQRGRSPPLRLRG
jgi:phenylalanyl-tRNA synthetase beta chain